MVFRFWRIAIPYDVTPIIVKVANKPAIPGEAAAEDAVEEADLGGLWS